MTSVPDSDTEAMPVASIGPTLVERLEGRLGSFDSGDADLSEDTERKFADLLAETHRKERS